MIFKILTFMNNWIFKKDLNLPTGTDLHQIIDKIKENSQQNINLDQFLEPILQTYGHSVCIRGLAELSRPLKFNVSRRVHICISKHFRLTHVRSFVKKIYFVVYIIFMDSNIETKGHAHEVR